MNLPKDKLTKIADDHSVTTDANLNPEERSTFEVKSQYLENSQHFNKTVIGEKQSNWASLLPFYRREEFLSSASIISLPEINSSKILQNLKIWLARFVFSEPENIEFQIVSKSEIKLSNKVKKLKQSGHVFIEFSAKPSDETATVVLENQFAVRIVNLVLDGKNPNADNQRNLSVIEYSVLKFLSLNILREFNDVLGSNTLYLQNVSDEPEIYFENTERAIVVVLQILLDDLSGFISLILPSNFLSEISKNNLVPKDFHKNKIDNLKSFTPDLNFRPLIGITTLDAESILALQVGDIVLVEHKQADFNDFGFANNLIVYIGSGKYFRLEGTVLQAVDNTPALYKIQKILSEEFGQNHSSTRIKMEKNESEFETLSQETENSSALQNLQVTVRVELAGRRISLQELQNLRQGQLIDLGCRPTDPVRLFTDNRDEPIAMGELVEIEGELGVKLTKVFI